MRLSAYCPLIKSEFLGVFNFVSTGDEVKAVVYAKAYYSDISVPLAHNYFVSTGDEYSMQLHISRLRTTPRGNYSPLGTNFHFDPGGADVRRKLLPHWDRSWMFGTSSPLAWKSKFASAGGRLSLRSRRAKVEAITEMVPQWDTIFSVIDYCARSSRCRNFCATGTQVNNAAPVRSNK